jgi:hypothetical protein
VETSIVALSYLKTGSAAIVETSIVALSYRQAPQK